MDQVLRCGLIIDCINPNYLFCCSLIKRADNTFVFDALCDFDYL